MKAADLQSFCADETDIRVSLHKPWSAGEWTYASNGHIMVRVPRLADVPENAKAPNAQRLFDSAKPAITWMPVPVATMPPDVDCDKCSGTGLVTCNDEFEHDCDWCEQTGKIRQHIGVEVGNVFFDQGYLSLIQGWEIAPNGFSTTWIRNGEVDGLLMPRREK